LHLTLVAITLVLMGDNRFTLAEVASLARAKPHAVQYWAWEGILRPTPETVGAGRGKQRMFPAGEVRVAAIAAALGSFSISMPTLKSICKYVRPVIAPESAPHESEITISPMKAIQAGEQVYMTVEPVYLTVEPSAEIVHVSFIEPKKHNIELEDLFRLYGPFFVGLVNLQAVLAGLP